MTAIDRLLSEGIRLGPRAKRNAINKILELVPTWTRGDCWRRLRQLRKRPQFVAAPPNSGAQKNLECTKRVPVLRGASRPWTAADDDRLLNWAGYEPVKKIAQRLGRSESSVRFRMGSVGISAKVKDGWSLRSLRKLLRVSPSRLRFLIGQGLLRVRDPRITFTSIEQYFENHRASFDAAAVQQFAAAREIGEPCSWDRAAQIVGIEIEQIKDLICSGTMKLVDPFVTDRQFEEFCKKHGKEINLSMQDAGTAKWLIEEYGVPQPQSSPQIPSRAQKHALVIRVCKCGKRIAGNAYFRHVRTCKANPKAAARGSATA